MASRSKSDPSGKPRRRIAARVFIEPGAAPGTLKALENSAPPVITVLQCPGDGTSSLVEITGQAALPHPAAKGMRWVRVTGLGAMEPLQTVMEHYNLSRLAMEDTLTTGGRTKLEQQEQSEFAFFVLQAPPRLGQRGKGEHLSMFCKNGLIITFEDTPTSLVNSLWNKLQKTPPAGGGAHLAEMVSYMVLDMIVDSFFPHLDAKDEALAELEECVSEHTLRHEDLNRLHMVKRDLITLRRLLSPFKELRADLQKIHSPESAKELRPFLNDLNDHVVQAGELLDTYYEVAKSLDDISQSMISTRMNGVIKILTIISTVFMPLSFIAGIYGMNFDTKYPLNMPELALPFGYPLVLLLMAGIVAAMLWWFKKKDWL